MKKSVGRSLCVIVLFAISVSVLSAQEVKHIAVFDFDVQSENPSYKFLGKGFAEFIAVELSSTEGIVIIDREKRNEILEEQKFSQTGLTDESSSIELGNLLAAGYLISGSIFDMFGQLEVTMKITDIEHGTAVAQVQAGGEPKQYKAIVSELAEKVTDSLDIGIAATPKTIKVADVALDNEQADVVLASFSEAMDAVDKNDVAAAKEKLKTVQKVDKTNEAARYYLNKLQALSPKFRVEMVEYVTPYSAASLGFIENGAIYFWWSAMGGAPWLERTDSGAMAYILDDEFAATDASNVVFAGVSIPIGENMGIGAGITNVIWDLHAQYIGDETNTNIFEYNGEYYDDPHYSVYDYGVYGSFGIALTDWLGIGCSAMGWLKLPGGSSTEVIMGSSEIAFSVYPGFMIQSPDGNLVIDLNGVYTNSSFYYVDTSNNQIIHGQMPVVIDSSVTYGLFDQQLFLGLKGFLDIYIDSREGHALRLIPMAEWWLFDFLSVRAGYEYSHLYLMDVFTIGHGAVGGTTLKLSEFDINVNFTYRNKPVKMLPGYTLPDIKLMIGLEYSPEFLKR